MSGRSRRETLVRVAEVRAMVARRAVAEALGRRDSAALDVEVRQDRLAAAGLAGGSPVALSGTTQTRLLRAAALREAEDSVRLATLASDAALRAWTDARRAQRLAEQLREREREEKREARNRAEQRELDDLAGQLRAREERR